MSIVTLSNFNNVVNANKYGLLLIDEIKRADNAETATPKTEKKGISFLTNSEYKALANGQFSFVSDSDAIANSDEKGKRKTAKKKLRYAINESFDYSNSESMSEIIGFYFWEISYRFVKRGLKTILTSQNLGESGFTYINQLYCDAVKDSLNVNRFSENNAISTEISVSRRYKDKLTGKMFKRKKAVKTQKIVYDKGKNLDVSARLDDRPVIKEEYHNIDVDNIFSCVYLFLCELYRAKQITNFSDVELQKGAIYSVINSEVSRQRQKHAEMENYQKYCVVTHENGIEEITIAKNTTKEYFNKYSDLCNMLLSSIGNFLDVRVDKEKAVSCFVLCKAFGITQSDVASRMNVKQQQIARWIKTIEKACENNKSNIREMIG